LLCRQPFDFDDLEQATAGLARAINPHIEVETASADRSGERLLTIAVGDGEHNADLEVGCEGWCALFGAGSAIVDQPESIWAAALASCLAGAFAFHRMMGNRFELAASHSLWEGGAAGNRQGPALTGPLDLGRVLQVGVGAVGSAVDFADAMIASIADFRRRPRNCAAAAERLEKSRAPTPRSHSSRRRRVCCWRETWFALPRANSPLLTATSSPSTWAARHRSCSRCITTVGRTVGLGCPHS
jgi:hypothetical protein